MHKCLVTIITLLIFSNKTFSQHGIAHMRGAGKSVSGCSTPSPITGTPYICGGGATTSLSDITGTGTWSSSSTATATVNSSGVVTASNVTQMTLQTTRITYSIGTGCNAIMTVTVNVGSPTFTVKPGATTCSSPNNVTIYNTQGTNISANSYVWSLPGTLNTDYAIQTGCTNNTNTCVLRYLTTSAKTVTVYYTTMDGNCVYSSSPAPSTTTPFASTTATYTTQPDPTTSITTTATYTTQGSQTNYIWSSSPLVAGEDYTIISGGIGITNSTVTIQFEPVAEGNTAVFTVNYKDSNGCISTTATSSTLVTP